MPFKIPTIASVLICLVIASGLAFCGGLLLNDRSETEDIQRQPVDESQPTRAGLATATFGSGCFWCTEAVFQELEGVTRVVSGYSGGRGKNPTYREVCSGESGHAEVIQVTYDPREIAYEQLLEVFWQSHDPTTLNRQGNDEGTQYRSVIFYHDEEQHRLATAYRQKLDQSGAFRAPIVTEISPMGEFYPAEDYHQNYFRDNSREPYCTYVIRPKLEKFRKVFADRLRKPSRS